MKYSSKENSEKKKNKSKVKEKFPKLEDLMFNNPDALRRSKKKKYFNRKNKGTT